MSQTRFKLAAKNAVIDLTFNIFTLLRTLSIWSMYQFFSGENLKHKKEKVNWWNIAEKVVLNDHDLLIPLYTTEHNYIKKLYNPAFEGEGKTKLVQHGMVQVNESTNLSGTISEQWNINPLLFRWKIQIQQSHFML